MHSHSRLMILAALVYSMSMCQRTREDDSSDAPKQPDRAIPRAPPDTPRSPPRVSTEPRDVEGVMSLERLRSQAFSLCQHPFSPPQIIPVPVVDPPVSGGPESLGMTYQEEGAIKTSNLFERNNFYFLAKPRAGTNRLPMQIFVDRDGAGKFQSVSWEDTNADYSSPAIQPPIIKTELPPAARVLSELIVGHRSPLGDFPQLFNIRAIAYLRFAGFPPQVPGASLRLAAHKVFEESPGHEDFPVIRKIFVGTRDKKSAQSLILIENNLLCGALSLDMAVADSAKITVDGYWYFRKAYHWRDDPNTGLMAFSSMFWKGPRAGSNGSDSAHDSDTLLIRYPESVVSYAIRAPETGLETHEFTGSLTERPLGSLTDEQPLEWTLANDDRDPAHYSWFAGALGSTNYNFRASYHITLMESSVKTRLQLFEHATHDEFADNIVVLASIRDDVLKSASANDFVHFKYMASAVYP